MPKDVTSYITPNNMFTHITAAKDINNYSVQLTFNTGDSGI